MKDDLRGTHHIQSAISIHKAAGTESLHHRLLICFYMIGLFHHHFTVFENGFHIPVTAGSCCHQIALIICSHRT